MKYAAGLIVATQLSLLLIAFLRDLTWPLAVGIVCGVICGSILSYFYDVLRNSPTDSTLSEIEKLKVEVGKISSAIAFMRGKSNG